MRFWVINNSSKLIKGTDKVNENIQRLGEIREMNNFDKILILAVLVVWVAVLVESKNFLLKGMFLFQ